MGPKTICFMMDEFAKLPKSETVLTGPDLGRSKKVSYWLIFQARSQIVKTYSKEDGTTIDSTCGVTVLISPNDAEKGQTYPTTIVQTHNSKPSLSQQPCLSRNTSPLIRTDNTTT